MDLYILGDQIADCQTFLQKCLLCKDRVLLSSFFHNVYVVLREEISQQSFLQPETKYPVFNHLQELVQSYYEEHQPYPALDSAIVCLSQLANFIEYSESHPTNYLPSLSYALKEVRILGVCVGLIASSAIACANSLSALVPLAVEAVRVAFRLGAHGGNVAQRLEIQRETPKTWSTRLSVKGEEPIVALLKDFHQENGIPLSNQVWISVVSNTHVVISGPPSVRQRLLDSSELHNASQVEISIWGAYHASHLYSEANIEKIIAPQTRAIFKNSSIHFVVHSSADGKKITASTPLQLLESCLQSILMSQLRWDKVITELASGSLMPTDEKCKVHAIGPTNLAYKVASAFRHSGILEVSMEDHTQWMLQQHTNPLTAARNTDSNIAIVGMAGRFPDAADHNLLWELLEKGLDVHREVPKDRYNVKTHTDPTSSQKNTSHTPYGCFITDPGLFDARFFNMSPREATQTDPMQRLTLTTAYEAMEMAGIVPGRTPSTMPDRIGTFYGQTSDDWREINAAQDIDTYFISGGVRAFGPGRVNYFFKFGGPSFTVDTACSSSFAAIQLACTSLRAGECDTAFTGGANVLTNPDIFSGLSRGHFLSKTGSCKTFDNDADGYCRGDGVATVILKRFDDAVIDKDPILGVILGMATNHSAEAVSITHPHAGAQQFIFSKILQESGVDAHEISYVEMHGTGTQAGDGIEMQSVSTVFAPTHKRRRENQPLHLGSLKANIGHGEAASGVCALIKALLMLRENIIPPHCGIKGVLNKNFPKDLQERNVHIALRKTPLPRPVAGTRKIFINNFSAAGGNTGLLLEDGPQKRLMASPDPRSTHVVTVSAKSLSSYRRTIQQLQAYIKDNPDIDIPSLSYTSTARRLHYNYRAAFAATDLDTISFALAKLQEHSPAPVSVVSPKIAFVFTGQGSQYNAIGKQLYKTSNLFHSKIEEFQEIAECQGFPSFLGLIDGSVKNVENLPPVAVQLGLVSLQMALVCLWKSWGIRPKFVIGHSLGEYAALNAAGVLSVADTIFLVGMRAMMLERRCTVHTHAMLAVSANPGYIRDVLKPKNIQISCINTNVETVISGTSLEIDSFAEILGKRDIRCKKLNVPYAFHSSQVDGILESFEKVASAVTFHPPAIPIISPILSEVISVQGVFGPKYLRKHARNTVNFLQSLTAAASEGVIDEKVIWVEIGPHPICSHMIRLILAGSTLVVPSLRRDQDAWRTVADSMCVLYSAGVPLDWSAYHHDFSSSLQLLNLPAYSFDNKVYWIDYINDWTLTKGDSPIAVTAAVKSEPITTSIHRIISEKTEGNAANVVAESDLVEPLLHSVVSGHLINGIGLCPSSLYADMALTLANYTYKLLLPEAKIVDMNVGSMTCPNPLFLKSVLKPESQLLRVEANVNLANHQAEVVITATNGKTRTIHAKCTVHFEDSSQWLLEWQRMAFLTQTRVDLLEQKLKDGKASLILRGMAYKLFAALVQYSDKFRGIKEVILDSHNLEATARIDFQAGPQDGKFFTSPYFIDSVGHLSGFIMNANDAVDSHTQVYISHGWDSMRFAKPLVAGKKYRTWVKMQGAAGKMVAGDVYLFDEDKTIIGVLGGLRFQCIPRTLFNSFLPTPIATTATSRMQTQETAPGQKTPPKLPQKNLMADKELTKNVPSASGNVAKALDIIASEIGIELSELADNIDFRDFGVDSLMALAISGRFREELGLEIQSSLFFEFPSVGDLKVFLSPNGISNSSDHLSKLSKSVEDSVEALDDKRPDCPATDWRKAAVKSNHNLSNDEQIMAIIHSVIAQEMEVNREEIAETTDLFTVGMDSLMSLTILGRLREEITLSIEPNLLTENRTLADIRKALDLGDQKPPVPALPKTAEKAADTVLHYPKANSVLLQGNPKTATRKLFLFPDGSGSATSYVAIPPILPDDLCVYGLNCPYMRDPTSYTCGIEGVCAMYISEVFRRQPDGPYLIGGWSAGGVVAYQVWRELAEINVHHPDKNLSVSHLILIDAPCPIRLEPLPTRLHHFINSIGLLGTGDPADIPAWLLPHFEYSVKNLAAYSPVPISRGSGAAVADKTPKTLLIWARDGICKFPDDPRPVEQEDDPNSMKWLLNNRTDFGCNGWDQLLVADKCTYVDVAGNHFTMMRAPLVHEIADLIRRAIEA